MPDALPTPWRTQMWVQVKDSGRRRSRDVFPSSQHLRGRGACWSSGMGLGRIDKLIHSHGPAHNPHKVVSAKLEHLWCWDQPRATRTHKTHHGPDLGEATTFPLIVYFVTLHGAHIQMAFHSWDSRDSRPGVPKSRPAGLPGLWSLITLRADLGSKRGLKQSCSSPRELSNGMSHVVCSQVFRVDSRLLVVGSQNWQTPGTPGSSTPGPSFGHNLCFRCSNEQCEPILDIYASRAFQWYKERHKTLRFDPSNRSLKFRESTGTPSPKVGVALGVWRLTPSHSPTLPGVFDVTPGLPLGPHPCNPFALVASPKLGLRQCLWIWELYRDNCWAHPSKVVRYDPWQKVKWVSWTTWVVCQGSKITALLTNSSYCEL
jgi:hypothetical protein